MFVLFSYYLNPTNKTSRYNICHKILNFHYHDNTRQLKILKFYRRFCLDVKWSNNVLADIDFHRILPLVLNPKLLNRIGWPIQIYAYRAVPEHKNFESRAAVVHLNFRAGSTFPFPVCTVPSLCTGLAGAKSLTRSDFMLYIAWIYF